MGVEQPGAKLARFADRNGKTLTSFQALAVGGVLGGRGDDDWLPVPSLQPTLLVGSVGSNCALGRDQQELAAPTGGGESGRAGKGQGWLRRQMQVPREQGEAAACQWGLRTMTIHEYMRGMSGLNYVISDADLDCISLIGARWAAGDRRFYVDTALVDDAEMGQPCWRAVRMAVPPEVQNLRWASLGQRVSLLAARNISTGEQLLMPLTRDSPFYGFDSSEFQSFNDATPRLMTQNDD